jgi:hypothetical protein
VTDTDVPRPLGSELDREARAGRTRSWCRRIVVVAGLSLPVIAAVGGSARASTVTDTLDGATEGTVEAVEIGTVPDVVDTGTVDDAVSSATDQLSTHAGPIKQELDEQVASVNGTVDGIARAADGTVDEVGDAIGEAGSSLDTVVPTPDPASSHPGGSRGGSPSARVRPSLDASASIGRRPETGSNTTSWARTEFGGPTTDPNDAQRTSPGSSGHLASPSHEPVGAPGLPVSIADGVGHTLLLMLIGLFVGAFAHASPGLRRNRPPPSDPITLVLVLSLERPG